MVPTWLTVLAWLSIGIAFLCAGSILYAGPLAVLGYFRVGRPSSQEAKRNGGKPPEKHFWETAGVGVTHCGAGCTVGDIIAEFAIFFAGLTVAGSVLGAEFIGDYVLAYVLGIAFQYFSIAPMRGLSFGPGVWAAIKADTLSLTAFEIGLFGWMALSYFVFSIRISSRINPRIG